MASENKIEELEDKLLCQEVYNRREHLRFFGIPEPTSGMEDVPEVVHKFPKEERKLEVLRISNSKESIASQASQTYDSRNRSNINDLCTRMERDLTTLR